MDKELDIKISYKCNNACVFCLNKDKRSHEVDFELIKKTVEGFAKNDEEKLIISGGEPLISKNFFELLVFSKQKGIRNFEIQTNGRMLYYEEMVKRLKNFQNIAFLVSFHFPTDKLYRKYCRSDGFSQTLKGLKNLIKHDFNFTVNTVIMKQNIFYLEEIIKVLKKIGVDKRRIQYRFIDGKNVINNYYEFVPRYSECMPFIEKLIKKNKRVTIQLNEFPFCVFNNRKIRDNLMSFRINPKRVNLSNLGEKITTEKIINSQFVFPNCDKCYYKSKCLGVRKEYVDFYGSKEFNSITDNS